VIQVTLELDEAGCLRALSASGHAGSSARGSDPVCAAVSALLRTAARLLYRRPGLSVTGRAADPGQMELRLGPVPEAERSWLKGVTDLTASGLLDLAEQYPERVSVVVKESAEGGQ
jgi:uncharacterized protein YsxB (DUF464 family)